MSGYQYADGYGTYISGDTEQGGGSYYHEYSYYNANTGYSHQETVTAQIEGDHVFQDTISTSYDPTYHHALYLNQSVYGTHAQGYQVYEDTAVVNSYGHNTVYANGAEYGYVRGSSYAYGYGGGEEISGYRVTDTVEHGSSYFSYSGYAAFGFSAF